jgi:hypothetical protein
MAPKLHDIEISVVNDLQFLEDKLQSVLFPMEIFALVVLIMVQFGMYFWGISAKFPANLFRWVLWVDIGYGIFMGPLRWSPFAPEWTGELCKWEAGIHNFFQIGSLYTNSMIVLTIFYKIYYLRRMPHKSAKYTQYGFLLCTVPAFLSVFVAPVTDFIGWCVVDSVSLVLKQVAWYLFMACQLILLIPTNYLIWKATKSSRKTVKLDVYVRISGVIVTQTLMLAPLLISELNSVVRNPIGEQMAMTIAVCFPLAHILDSALVGSRLLMNFDSTLKKNETDSDYNSDSASTTGDFSSSAKSSKGSGWGTKFGGMFGSKKTQETDSKTSQTSGEPASVYGASNPTQTKTILRRIRLTTKKKGKEESEADLKAKKNTFDAKEFIRNATIILLSPLIGLGFVGILSIQLSGGNARLGRDTNQQVPFTRAVIDFLHQVQIERDVAMGLLTGTVNLTHVDADLSFGRQVNNTIETEDSLFHELDNIDLTEITESDSYKDAEYLLGMLDDVREDINAADITAEEVQMYYSALCNNLTNIQTVGALAVRGDSVDYSLIAYVAVSRGVELLTHERMRGLEAIESGELSPQEFSDLVSITIQEDTYLDIFMTFADPNVVTYAAGIADTACYRDAMAMRETILANDPSLLSDVSEVYWYGNLTCLITEWNRVDRSMNRELVTNAEAEMKSTVSLMIGLMIGFVVLICWTTFLVFGIVFSSNAPKKILDYLERTMFGYKVPFQGQILAALSMPSIIVLVLFMTNMSFQVYEVQYNARLVAHLDCLEMMSSMVSEYQNERDFSALYFSTEGQGYIDELRQQYVASDTVREAFSNYIVNNPSDILETPEFEAARLSEVDLNEFRMTVWEIYDLNTTDQVRAYYTDIIETYMDVYVKMMEISRKDDFFFDLLAYVLYVPSKTISGEERLAGVTPFAVGGWSSLDLFKEYAGYANAQIPYYELSKIYFTQELITRHNDLMSGASVALVEQDRATLLTLDTTSIAAVDPLAWYVAATDRISRMSQMADELDANLFAETDAFANRSSQNFMAVCIVIISAFVLSDNFTTLIMWRLVKLAEIARNMKFKNRKKAKAKRRGKRSKKSNK